MESYSDRDSYLEALASRAAAPEGFRFAVIPLEFSPVERETGKSLSMKMSAAVLDEATPSFAGMYTRNAFPGAPVIIGRKRLGMSLARGVLANNKVSNVCAPGGVETAERLTARLASLVGCGEKEIFPASTGIIGWRLPEEAMTRSLAPLVARLGADDPLAMAEGIMTTDSFPKLRSAEVESGRIVAVAKGAGMIEPNLATLLVFIFTDLTIAKEALAEALGEAVRGSFNTISIDSDQSTSDTVLAFSSNRRPLGDTVAFSDALARVCRDLASDVVRNGEGTEHVLRVTVDQAASDAIASGCAKAVVNSPLVKTAVCGNDPNVGRIIGAVGDYLGSQGFAVRREAVVISIGEERVFDRGAFTLDPRRERSLSDYFVSRRLDPAARYPAHDRCVEIGISLGSGGGSATAIGSDLTHGYVSENADYRS